MSHRYPPTTVANENDIISGVGYIVLIEGMVVCEIFLKYMQNIHECILIIQK